MYLTTLKRGANDVSRISVKAIPGLRQCGGLEDSPRPVRRKRDN